MQNINSIRSGISLITFQMPAAVIAPFSKMGNAARAVLSLVGTGAAVGYESIKHRVNPFSLDPHFKELMTAQIANVRLQATQAGVAGFFCLFATISIVVAVIVSRRNNDVAPKHIPAFTIPKSTPTQDEQIKEAVAKFKTKSITAGECLELIAGSGVVLNTCAGFDRAIQSIKELEFDQIVELFNSQNAFKEGIFRNLDVFELPWIQELAELDQGADKIKQLLQSQVKNEGILWNVKRTMPSFTTLLFGILKKENGIHKAMTFLKFTEPYPHLNWVLDKQVDAVIPVLTEIAHMEGGKEEVKAFLLQDTSECCKFLAVPKIFVKAKVMIDSLKTRHGTPLFHSRDLKEFLDTKYVPSDVAPSHVTLAPIHFPKVFIEAVPWLKQIAADPNGGRKAVLELLTIGDHYGATPLHNKIIIPHALLILKEFKPSLSDEEISPLLFTEQIFKDWGREERTVPLQSVEVFVFASPWLKSLIEKGDKYAIYHAVKFIKYDPAVDDKNLSPESPVFKAVEPLIAPLVARSKLDDRYIPEIFRKKIVSLHSRNI